MAVLAQRLSWPIAAIALLFLVAPAAAQTAEQVIYHQLGEFKSTDKLRIGIAVQDVQNQRMLTDLQAGLAKSTEEDDPDLFLPASNLKLLTSGTALRVLGPDYQFITRIIKDGSRIVIIGSGDPGLGDPELLNDMGISVDDFLDQVASSIRISGVTGITEVIVDDRVFDRRYVHSTWPRDQLNRWYCAEVCGVNFHANVVQISTQSLGSRGTAPRFRSEPSAPWIELVARARRVDKGTTALWAAREPDRNKFTIYGQTQRRNSPPFEVTLHEGSLVFGRLIADRLQTLGLNAPEHRISARLADFDEWFDLNAQTVAAIRTPLSVVLERCNTDSHNLYAESLLKLLGHRMTQQPGSWVNGAAVVRATIHDRLGGRQAANIRLSDGSGLSRGNRVPASLLVEWLGDIARDPDVADAFFESLPVAAENGTLQSRFEHTQPANEVRAKSGYINGVRTLSGYITNKPTGRQLAFSILVNDIPGDVRHSDVKRFQEDVVLALDEWFTSRVAREVSRETIQEAIGG